MTPPRWPLVDLLLAGLLLAALTIPPVLLLRGGR